MGTLFFSLHDVPISSVKLRKLLQEINHNKMTNVNKFYQTAASLHKIKLSA